MIKAGSILKDNDPRVQDGIRLVVVKVEDGRALCQRGQRTVKIRLDRIFADGKPRRSGFDVVA